jgi:hypothetical protein
VFSEEPAGEGSGLFTADGDDTEHGGEPGGRGAVEVLRVEEVPQAVDLGDRESP